MALEGSLEILKLPEILQMIAGQKKTGILTVQGEQDIIAISFLHGDVVAADALNQTVEEGLGQVLASKGLVAPADFAAVSAEHQTGSGRLVDLLLQRNYLTRAQLLEALRTQTYNLLAQILNWKEGTFKFYGGEEVAYEEGFRPISVEELLIRALGESEEGEAALPELSAVYEAITQARPIHVIDLDATGSAAPDPSVIWLRPEEKTLLDDLDGERSAASLALDTGLGEYKVLYGLYRLQQQGLARLSRRVTARSPAVKPPAARPATPTPVPVPEPRLGSPDVVPIREAGTPRRAPADASARAPLSPSRPATPVVPFPRAAAKVAPLPQPSAAELLGEVSALPGRLLGAVLVVALAAVLVLAPRRLELPYPGQGQARATSERVARAARYLKIDRAARTHFLLEGRYPDNLAKLVELGLLSARDVLTDGGHLLAYSSDAVSYTLQPVDRGEAVAELGASEGISGDFLLDPEFLKNKKKEEAQPLVLLD
ncbi:MAG: DUF4388 domain-containing protein [Acidobacteriota bacterium]